MRHRRVIIALLGAFPVVILATWSGARILLQFSDPLFQWELPRAVSGHVSTDVPYSRVRGTSDTKLKAAVRLALVQGGILIASVLGVLGALLRRSWLSALGTVLMFLESVPLMFSFSWLTALAGGLFLWSAKLARTSTRPGLV